MKSRLGILGAVLAAALFLAPSIRAAEYTLDDLYRIALERSEQIRISEEDLTIARIQKNQALSVILPKLSAYTSYLKYSEDKYNNNLLVQPDSAQQWGFRMDQQFSLSFRELTALSIAGNNIEKSRQDLSTVKEGYLLQVALAYFDVLRAKKSLDIAQANLDRLSKYRDAAEKRLKVGEVTKTVVLRALSELSGARSDKVKAENLLALSRAVLARTTGIDRGFTLRETRVEDLQIAPLPELKDTAYTERTELKSLDSQKKMARQEVTYASGAFWPNIAVSGVYQRSDQDPQPATLNRESVYGALSLNFPFFEGGLRKAELEEAKAKQRQADLLYDETKKGIGMEVENAYLELTTAKSVLTYLADQLTFARDNYYAVSKQFELGLASSLDVMDANTLLVSSERQLSEATYTYQMSILRVKRAIGMFLKEITTGR